MPLVIEPTQPAQLGSVAQIPDPEALPPASVMGTLGAATRLSNVAGSFFDRIRHPEPATPHVPGFDPLASIPAGFEPYADRFLDAHSPEEMEWTKNRINDEIEDKRTLERAGGWGIAASMASGMTDPLTIASMAIPVGGETRLAQAGRMALINSGTTAAQEGLQHELSLTRTASESAFNVAGSAVLGGILGAVIRPHVPSKIADTIGSDLSRELHTPDGGEKVLGPEQRTVVDTALPSDMPESFYASAETQPKTAQDFLSSIEEEHPGRTDDNEILLNDNVRAQLSTDPLDARTLHIERIEALEQDKGTGSEAMKMLTDRADREGINLTLDAQPLDENGISAEKLRNWYERFGFQVVRDEGGKALMERPAAGEEIRSPREGYIVGDALQPYLPTHEEVTATGAEASPRNMASAALVTRALEIDEAAVQSLVHEHAGDSEGFLQAIRAFVDERGSAHEGRAGGESTSHGAAESSKAGTASQEIEAPAEPVTSPEYINPGDESTSGAAAVAKTNMQGERIARGARTIAEGPIGRVAPGLRVLASPSIEARRLVQELANTPEMLEKNRSGIATPQPIERKLWGYEGTWYQGWKARSELFRTYGERMATADQPAMSRREFGAAVSGAMRRGDVHEIPEVAQAAQKTRALIFDPLKQRAMKLGLLPEDVKATGADSYLTRQYDARTIRENLGKWLDTLTEGFKAQGVDPAEARDIAHKATRNVLGSERGTMDWKVMDDIVPQSGRMKERTLNLPDALLEPYLTSDIDHLSHSYLRSMAPEVEMTERFGTRDMKDQLDGIKDEYARLMEQAKVRGEDIAPLEKQMRADLRDLGAIRDRLYGIYGQPKDPGAFMVRAGKMIRSDNALRLLGAATLAHFPDLANVIVRYGMPNTFSAIGRILSSSSALQLTRSEAKRMGAALDMTMNMTSSLLGDYGSHSQFAEQRVMAKATRAFTIITGETPLITAVQALTSTLAQHEVLTTAEKLAAGGEIPANQAARLAAAGLDEPMLRRIAEQGGKFAQEANGLRFGMSDTWADQRAAAAFESAVLREAHGVTLRPGAGDTPLFMSSELGKTILQFKTFAFAANRIIVNPLLQGLASGDLRAIQGMFALAFMGAASYVAKQTAAGQPVELDKPGRLAMEVADKSNLLGWTGEVVFPGLWQLGMKDLSRWSDRDAAETLLGPSAGTVATTYERRFPSKLTADTEAGEKGFQRSDLHFLRRLLPGQNLWYFRRGINAMEDAVGDAFDLPGESNADRAAKKE